MTFDDPSRILRPRSRFRPTRTRQDGDAASPAVADAPVVDPASGPRRIRRIVLTGGPGSGKSTAASFLAREFVDELWVLPESATLLYRGGLPRATVDLGQQISQRAIFTVQRSLEQASELQHPGRVQLCDRGTVDGAAYWPDGADAFFRAMGTSHERELARYDAVIFLHTAAMLPAGYERDMEVRTEGREEAIELDRRIHGLYAGHPRLITVRSQGSFLGKLTVVREAIASLVADDGVAPMAPGAFPRPGISRVPLRAIDGEHEPVGTAPLSALMGLASMQHVLPTVD